MPIVDGLTSTKMIRSYEKTTNDASLSQKAALNGRVPIFAVSASLLEKDRQIYIDAGFDGWILKPVDFKRLGVLMAGIIENDTRNECLYEPGEWERGGWFMQRQPDIFQASTTPASENPVKSEERKSFPRHEDDPIGQEQDRLASLQACATRADSSPRDPGTSGNLEASGPS